MKKTFMILNNQMVHTIEKDSILDALTFAENHCDFSKEIVLREIHPDNITELTLIKQLELFSDDIAKCHHMQDDIDAEDWIYDRVMHVYPIYLFLCEILHKPIDLDFKRMYESIKNSSLQPLNAPTSC